MLSFPLIESLTIQTTVNFEKNSILRDDKGREQRIIPHQAPLRKFNLTKKILTDSDVNDLFSLFESLKGAGDSFLYQDKSDYKATHTANILAAGVYTQGVIIKSGSTYLLCKKYACGDNIHYRPIYHADTLTIYSGDTIVTGWTFFDGGTITGLSGDGYTANFTFKTPVRFETDKLENIISTSKNSSDHLLYSLNSVILSETRQSIPIILTDTFLDDCGHTFQIDFLFNSTLSKNYTTEIIPLASGYEKLTPLQNNGTTEIDFGDRTQLTQDHLEYLLCIWLNTKGCGAFFDFEDSTNTSVKARFDNLPLTYTQRSPLPYPKYEVKGLKARLFYEGVLEDTGYNGWVGSVLTLCDCIKIETSNILTCTPSSSTFTNSLSSLDGWSVASSDDGTDNLGNVGVVINSGKWRVTTDFVQNCSKIFASSYSYTPIDAAENISFSFSINAQMIVTGLAGQLFNFFLIQNGLVYPGGFQLLSSSSPTTIIASGTLSDFGAPFMLGVPIYLGIGFGNSLGSLTGSQNIADYWNFNCVVTVTCN